MTDSNLILAHKVLRVVQFSSFERGRTPLSTLPAVMTVLALYLSVILSIKIFMRDRHPVKLKSLLRSHNFILTLGSGALLSLFVKELVPIYRNDGLFGAICYQSSWTIRLEKYYMINYGFKYIQLLDTVFLSLRKKPLPFLHVYHHSATILLAYIGLNGKLTASWLPTVLNLVEHVFMYYYYFATVGGGKIWWKKYITVMQIAQFIIVLCTALFGLWQRFAFNGYVHLPYIGDCSGSVRDVLLGSLVFASYLGLFIEFYIRTYQKSGVAKLGLDKDGLVEFRRDTVLFD